VLTPFSAFATAPTLNVPLVNDSGTLAATSSLINDIPPLSAGDFSLGMPADKAIALMKSKDMQMPNETWNNAFQISQIPGHELVGGAHGKSDAAKGREEVYLRFTTYPSTPVVVQISRSIDTPVGKEPTVSTLLTALRKKYGPETARSGENIHLGRGYDTVYWLYDYKGQPLTKTLGSEKALDKYLYFCADNHGINDGLTMFRQGYRIEGNFPGTKVSRHICYDTIVITAKLSSADPYRNLNKVTWAQNGDVPVRTVSVTITDKALDASAINTTRNLALHNQQIEQKKKLDATRKNQAPAL
jgi:hypothetical protein